MERRRQIFRNAGIAEAQLEKDGFVQVPFPGAEAVSRLKKVLHALDEDVDHSDVHIRTPFRLSAFHNDAGYKSRIYDAVWELLGEGLEDLLLEYEPLVINVFEKQPGDLAVYTHFNPSFVTEPYYKSVSVWIPLVDARKENGTLGVVPGSHDCFDVMRAANIPDMFGGIQSRLVDEYYVPLEVPAGQAIVLDDSLIHWSYPNLSDEVRITVQLIMVPREAPHIYYYYNTTGKEPVMELYEVSKDFFFRFNCQAEPLGLKKIGSIPYRYVPMTEAVFLERVSVKNPSVRRSKTAPKRSLFDRIGI